MHIPSRRRSIRGSGLALAVTIVALLAAACVPISGSATPSPAATLSSAGGPGVSPTAAQVAQATAAPSATAPATLGPTATAAPTLTSVPSPTAAPTNTPSPAPTATSASPTATPAPAGAASLANVKLALQPVVSNLDRPLFVTHAGDGSNRIFIVGKGGLIWAWNGQNLSTFLDIRDRVLSSGYEQGLLGLAFAPDYRGSGVFYVDYTDRTGSVIISRFHVSSDANRGDPTTEMRLLTIQKPQANHNGGMIVFGPDGKLYVAVGDGGGERDQYHTGQSPSTLLAKILRLDVSDLSQPARVPADNPWAGGKTWNGGQMVPEAWQAGLRNAWRFSFDRQTGDLWIGDVGQDTYEEVDYVSAGANDVPPGGLNFGWSIMEGMHCYASANCDRTGLTLPVAEYTHAQGGCAITGGYVYRGQQVPSFSGIYFYGDFCSGKIWGLAHANGSWDQRLLLQSGLGVSSFGEDESGELYIADLNGGRVERLVAGQ